jgi:hypothetical protein
MFLYHPTFFFLKEKNLDFITEGENISANIILQLLQLKQYKTMTWHFLQFDRDFKTLGYFLK